MNNTNSNELSFCQRLEVMVYLFKGQSLRPLLDRFSDSQLVQSHEFLWNKLVEFHYETQKRAFVREEVTKKMIPSAKYQILKKCDLRLDYCKGVECISSNTECAGNKIKNNMDVMAEHIRGLIQTERPMSHVKEESYTVL